MIKAGPHEKIYPVLKPATIAGSLAAEGYSYAEILKDTHLSASELASPDTRVSLDQIIECCRNAARLLRDPFGAYRLGLQFHLSSYGMYGFAILCSTDFRRTMRFAEKYHQLAAPLAEIAYSEEDGQAIWKITPIPHPKIDAQLYRFLVELQFGIHVSLNRDIMGPAFVPQEFQVRYEPFLDIPLYRGAFGCEVRFLQPENRMIWDAAWMDQRPRTGHETTYAAVTKLCDQLMGELQLRTGTAGQVREDIFFHLMQQTSFDAVARHLHLSTRTLRRKLSEEKTSFRRLLDELKMQMAIKCLRDTPMTVEEIASLLGFGDAAGFRRAFRRWTFCGPLEFKDFANRLDFAHKAHSMG